MSVVKINIGDETNSDKRKFTSVSMTIDRDDVVNEIERLRSLYKITPPSTCCHLANVLIPKTYFNQTILSNSTDILIVWFGCKYLGAYKWYSNSFNEPLNTHHQPKSNILHDHSKNFPALNDKFESEIRNFCLKNSLSQRMERVIAHATICNLVDGEDIRLAYAIPKEETFQTNDEYFPTISGFLMTISHDATKTDVIEAYEQDVRPYQMAIREEVDASIPKNNKREVIYNQFKVREMYWRHKEGITIPTLAKENDPYCINANEEGNIRQAIKRYRDNLKRKSKPQKAISSYPTPIHSK